MIDSDHIYDITIIGGGPIGMFATFYAKMRNADVQLIESLPQLGGQVAALYPEKAIYDIAALPGVKGRKLIEYLEEQALHFDPIVHLNTSVTNLQKKEDIFEITTTKGTTYSRTVIVAIGNGAFSPRKLAVDYDPVLEDQHLFYYVRKIEDFTNQVVAIAGGGDSAVDWALSIAEVAKKVYIIHRRDQFRGLESNVSKLFETPNIEPLTPFLIDNLSISTDDKLVISLDKLKSEDHAELIADSLLVNYGFTADNKVLRQWNLEMDHNAMVVDRHMAGTIPGLYGIGDGATYPGRVKLIATGFGEVPVAVNEALLYLFPDKRQPLHSTQLFNQ